jgi:hypothetical protein
LFHAPVNPLFEIRLNLEHEHAQGWLNLEHAQGWLNLEHAQGWLNLEQGVVL